MNQNPLSVTIGSLRLHTPIICASGTFGYGKELRDLVDFKQIGAITTKTLTLLPRQGNAPPRIYETDFGVLNSIGLENPGVEAFKTKMLAYISDLATKIIVSVGGFSIQEYASIIETLAAKKAIRAFEINLSCPNLRLKKMISQDARQTYKTVRLLRRTTKKTLIVKITPEVTDIAGIAKACEDAGCDALALVNTFLGMAIDRGTRTPVLGNIYGGYSGKAIKPMSLYRVWRVYQSVKIPLIAGGGIESADDAIEFFLAGATAVSIGTINFVYPNQAAAIAKGLLAYLKHHNISNIKALKGALHA